MTMRRTFGWGVLLAGVCVSGCGRMAEGSERGFSSGDEFGDGDDNDDLGEDPESGGSVSESCFDGVVQPGELCQVQAPAPLDAGIDPCALAIADFDADGRLDLAVPNSDFWLAPSGTHVANVLRGLGNGDFAATQPHPAGDALPVGIATGDFDGDGRVDLATANNEAAQAFLLANLGSGMDFGAPEGVGVASTASSAASGDLDNDGDDDLVVTTPAGVTVVLGGPGGLVAGDTIDVGGSPMHAHLVDLDDDGNLDLVTAVLGPFGEAGHLRIFHGAGDGSFPEQVEHGLAGDPWWVNSGDVNMDGDLDLVVADYSVDQVSILLGNSLGGFSPRTEIGVCMGPQSVAIGDMNNDGANDLVVGCMDSDLVEIHLQVGGGEFELTRWFGTGSVPVSVQLGDLNSDGVLDIAWANQYGNSVGLVISAP